MDLWGLPQSFGSKHRRGKLNDSAVQADAIEHDIRQHLSKRYDLEDGNGYCLPVDRYFVSSVWKIESLCDLKLSLNNVKSKLNNFDLEKWHLHTSRTNLAGLVVSTVRQFKPELLTQAWCKFYDILESFPVILRSAVEAGEFNSIHLCEAPGAFVASLNHNLALNFPNVKWQWRASTLNPYYEGNPLQRMINDDRFLMKTLGNWVFGDDFTGNIYQKVNVESLRRTAAEIGAIHLVTADGSFDCMDDPAEQEGNVSPLLYCEAIAALNVLSSGGSFVLKIFTIFECQTVCLLYLLRCLFRKMSVYKPIVSKEGNSELYVVCVGFVGRDSAGPLIDELSSRMETSSAGPAMFRKEDISENFLLEIERCASFFTHIQIAVIERNIRLFESSSSNNQNKFNQIRKLISRKFVDNFCIRPLPDNGCLLGKSSDYKRGLHVSKRAESGTFADRQYLKGNDPSALIEFYKSKLVELHYPWPERNNILWLDSSTLSTIGSSVELSVKKGRPFKTILSSRFCSGDLLTIFNEVLKNTVPIVSYDYWSASAASFLHNRMDGLAYVEYKTVDVRDKPWLADYHSAQTECLRALCPVLQELNEGNNLVFIGLPLLTQFNVGLVFLIARHFGKIGFACPRRTGNCLIFQDLQSPDFTELDEILSSDCDELALLSLVDITALGDEYLETVTLLNQVLLRRTSMLLACNC